MAAARLALEALVTACPKGHLHDDKYLSCPICAAQASDQELRHTQLEYVRKAASGGYPLRVTKDSNRHLIMYTSYKRSFCGFEYEERQKMQYEPYSNEALAKCCPGCRSAFNSVVQEVIVTLANQESADDY
jgi:hypothetical protein